jgi:hypothetical protein
MILELLEPIKALPNSDDLLASSPLLKLLYTQIGTVMKSPELLSLLTTIVQGILGKNSNTESQAFKYLVRIVQVAGLELLDKRTAKKTTEDKQRLSKLLELIRICFRTCLELIIDQRQTSNQQS